MAGGRGYAEALRQAQIEGVAEADPSLDVEGWDTANKLVIITNSVLGQPATLADVMPVTGITGITPEQMPEGHARGQVVKLVARAERDLAGHDYQLSVQPEWLPASRFPGRRRTASRWASSSTRTSWACSSSKWMSAAQSPRRERCCAM